MVMNVRVCEVCGQPTQLGDLHEGAVVVHLECAKQALGEVREFMKTVKSGKKLQNDVRDN